MSSENRDYRLKLLDGKVDDFLFTAFSEHISDIKYNKKDKPIIAVMCYGQLRTFHKKDVHDSFKNMIECLKKRYKVICFFYVNKKSSFNTSNWHYSCLVANDKYSSKEEAEKGERGKFKKWDDQNSNGIEHLLNTLKIEYNIEYYDEGELEKLRSVSKYNSISQILANKCYSMVKFYDKQKKVDFDYIMKTRPDIIYNSKLFTQITKDISPTSVFYALDCIGVYPYHIYKYIINFIQYVDENFIVKLFRGNFIYNHFIDIICLKLSGCLQSGFQLNSYSIQDSSVKLKSSANSKKKFLVKLVR